MFDLCTSLCKLNTFRVKSYLPKNLTFKQQILQKELLTIVMQYFIFLIHIFYY